MAKSAQEEGQGFKPQQRKFLPTSFLSLHCSGPLGDAAFNASLHFGPGGKVGLLTENPFPADFLCTLPVASRLSRPLCCLSLLLGVSWLSGHPRYELSNVGAVEGWDVCGLWCWDHGVRKGHSAGWIEDPGAVLY